MSQKKVIVIGAGFGGLSAAALLASKGFKVQVLEKNDQSGGRASVYREKGFAFDMGPSWYLMPDVFEKFFAEFNKKPADFFELRRLDPAYRIFHGKGDYVDLSADLEKNMRLFETIEPGAAAQLTRYLAQSKYQYDVSMKDFLYRDYASLMDFFNRRLLFEGSKLHVFESLDTYTRRYFKSDKLRKILEYSMVFLGGAPKNTPAIYSLMSHIDFNLGVWYPTGGIGAVVHAIEELAKSHGAEFRFNSPVEKIIVSGARTTGVVVNGETIEADIVVSGADYHHTESALLGGGAQTYSEKYWERRTLAPSAFMLYLGYDRKIDGLEHHTLFFDNDWVRHFDAIFEHPEWPENPSYYVSCASKTDATIVPPGGEALVILVPVAAGLKDTDEIRKAFTEKVLLHLEELLGQNLHGAVVQKVFSQRDFSSMFNAYKGTALGLSHTLLQTAVFRPHHQSKKVANVYYTGQYTHPGIGMPMCLIASELVADSIQKQYG
jgi:phytoene desaturase